jgi:hypothetical protein
MGPLVRFSVGLRWALLVALAAACSKGTLPTLPDAAILEPAAIEATSDTVAIPPGGTRQLLFRLLGSDGEPVPDAVMNFVIMDDRETPGSGGAHLSFSTSLTDSDGAVTLEVIAGHGAIDQRPLTFNVHASAKSVALDLPIFITSSPLASVVIMPFYPDQTLGDDPVTTTNIYFYDGMSCSTVELTHANSPVRQVRTLSSDSPPPVFTSVVTSGVHAVRGVATGAHAGIVAQGCADVPGASLSANQTLLVRLPLARVHPSPAGTFSAVSQFVFPTPLPGTASARDIWKDLSNHPCDPARLLLDCIIDALSSSASDPLDCVPVAGGEGVLGDLLVARRAVSGGSRICADQLDASGRPSLETLASALFSNSTTDALRLDKLPDELVNAVTRLSVESTVAVTETSIPNQFNIDHILTAIDLPNAAVHSSITMTALAPTVWKAPLVSGDYLVGPLKLDSHGFTLRLGAAARFTFATASLAPRVGRADIAAFVTALVQGATRNDGNTVLQGCAALDSLLCSDIGLASGCARAACQAGLDALVQRLDASFSALDGLDLDFFLSGSALPIDRNGDLQADALTTGIWRADFKSRTGTTNVYGSWTAERLSPSN